jgi:hypothetical protein
MDAAKRVLNDVVTGIPDRAGVNVGLRIYGHEGDSFEERRNVSCRSSDLVVEVDGVEKRQLRDEIDRLEPTGWTPLALSLERAGDDFEDADDGTVNVVVLVTDGLETCGGDPCQAAGALRDGDQALTTNVVGFALAPDEQATLECIADEGGGRLLGADSADDRDGGGTSRHDMLALPHI